MHRTTHHTQTMTQQHSITPPPELVKEWSSLNWREGNQVAFAAAARWGADTELEACCEIAVSDPVCGTKHQRSMLVKHMRERRRPEPLSLKERALKAALIELSPNGKNAAVIFQALAALPD